MKGSNESVEELNRILDECLEIEDFEKAGQVSRELCRLQGLNAEDEMPEDFMFQIKQNAKKEKRNMNFRKLSKNTAKVAMVSGLVLLIGVSVSAAVINNGGVKLFKYGLTTGEISTEGDSRFNGLKLPDGPDSTKELVESKEGASADEWIDKKSWIQEDTVYESDDAIKWYPGKDKYRITEYTYEDYQTAAKDNDYKNVFKGSYLGNAVYTVFDRSGQEEDNGIDDLLEGEFAYGNGQFKLQQEKLEGENEVNVITGESTSNQREYVSSGYAYQLLDSKDRENGKIKTTTLIKTDKYSVILTFTGISEEDIHKILDDIDIEALM